MTDIFIPKKPPIYTWQPTPTFKNELEKQRYWQQQKTYWIEGWNHLPGTLYHYLQEQKIKDRVSGKTIRPIPRESDLWIHEEVNECRKAKQPSAMIKCRGIGLSTLGGSLANYFMRVNPGSTCLLTSADQSRISKLYNDKIKVTNENYNADIKYNIHKYSSTAAKTSLQLEVKHLDDQNNPTISYSELFCNQTNDSDEAAASFSGTGAIFGFFDEIALNKRRKKLLQSSVECFRNQLTGDIDGFLLTGGTCEDVLTDEELLEFQKLVLDATAYNMRVFFIPYWWRFMDKHGHVDKKAGELWYKKEYERLEKLDDTSHLRAFKKNNPGSLEDIFNLGQGTFFEEDVMEKIKLQLSEVTKNPTPEAGYNIVRIGERVEAIPNKKSNITILEHPIDNVDYVETIDGVAAGTESKDAGGSFVASIMWKCFDPNGYSYCPVALYYAEPKIVEQSYIASVDMCRYYNKFGNFKKIAAEGNASTGDHLSTFLEKEGLGKWIMYRKDLSGKGHSNTKKNFQYVTNDVRDWQIKQMNIILRKYIQNMRMKAVLKDWLKPSTENADIRDSSLMFPIYLGADFDKPVKKPNPIKHLRRTIVNVGGSNVVRWIEDIKNPQPASRPKENVKSNMIV